MENQAVEQMLKTAKEFKCPIEQVNNFLSKGYVPFPWQFEFHGLCREADKENGPNDIGVGGARGPGKSHAVNAQIMIDDCQRVPGLKCLFLRQTGTSARESFEDLIDRLIKNKINFKFNRAENVLKFTNGSKVLIGGFKDEKDIDKYIGVEYDLMAIEEVNQLTESKVIKLKGSLRTSKSNWRPRMYVSFNPGGIGHQWVKKRYITERPKEVRFIPATYKDNPYLDSGYVDYLEGLTGDLGKAWREGEFDLFAGQYFEEWRTKIHVIKPFDIPSEWKRFIMGDYGYSAPAAVYWGAISPDEQLFIYRELWQTKLTYKKLMEEIITMTSPSEQIAYNVFDPAIWAKKGESSDELSGAEIMEQTYYNITKKRLYLIKGNNDRINGWNVMREYLKPYLGPDGKLTAKLQIFETCPKIIETLPSLIYDEHKLEDLNTDSDDHGADAIRYGLMTRPEPSQTKEQIREKFFKQKMKDKKNKENKFFKMTGY
ncbi:MAG: phage terminase large subunit [Candidatus Pacebacteria bacterium]|nr:phage terminase large subunit [Candidatus Paceibacterota bacterium]